MWKAVTLGPVGVVFYQHQHLNLPDHGKCEAEKRSENKLQVLVAKYHEGKQLGKNQLKKFKNFLASMESESLLLHDKQTIILRKAIMAVHQSRHF